jgi:hypothetical protein
MTDFKSLSLIEQEAEMLREFLRGRPEFGIDPNSDNILDFKPLIQQKVAQAEVANTRPIVVQIEIVEEKSLASEEVLGVPLSSLSMEDQEAIMLREYVRTHPDYAPVNIARTTLNKLERLNACRDELMAQLDILFTLTANNEQGDQVKQEINSMISQLTSTVSRVRHLIG